MARRTLTTAVLVLGFSALASARALYRIDVRGSAPVIAQDQPVVHGTVVVFHRHPDGRLTGVPRELVGSIETSGGVGPVAATGTGSRIRLSSARVRASVPDQVVVRPDASVPARPMEPGDTLLLGPTGAGSPVSDAARAGPPPDGAARALAEKSALESQVFPGDPAAPANGGANGMNGANGAYGYGAGAGSRLSNPTMTGSANVANNGATATGPSGAQQGSTQPFNPINPNGYPATATNGPQSGANPIGPNGYPVPTTSSPRGKQ
jgi:hypothetical protein